MTGASMTATPPHNGDHHLQLPFSGESLKPYGTCPANSSCNFLGFREGNNNGSKDQRDDNRSKGVGCNISARLY